MAAAVACVGRCNRENTDSKDRLAEESQRVAGEEMTRSQDDRVSALENDGCEEPEMRHPTPTLVTGRVLGNC